VGEIWNCLQSFCRRTGRDNIDFQVVRIILKLIIKQQGVVVWTGFIRISIESSGGLMLSGSTYIIWQFVVFLVLLQC
jgi:hypothetical protein